MNKLVSVLKKIAVEMLLNEEMKKAQRGSTPSKNSVHGPNIKPSSTYNFKK